MNLGILVSTSLGAGIAPGADGSRPPAQADAAGAALFTALLAALAESPSGEAVVDDDAAPTETPLASPGTAGAEGEHADEAAGSLPATAAHPSLPPADLPHAPARPGSEPGRAASPSDQEATAVNEVSAGERARAPREAERPGSPATPTPVPVFRPGIEPVAVVAQVVETAVTPVDASAETETAPRTSERTATIRTDETPAAPAPADAAAGRAPARAVAPPVTHAERDGRIEAGPEPSRGEAGSPASPISRAHRPAEAPAQVHLTAPASSNGPAQAPAPADATVPANASASASTSAPTAQPAETVPAQAPAEPAASRTGAPAAPSAPLVREPGVPVAPPVNAPFEAVDQPTTSSVRDAQSAVPTRVDRVAANAAPIDIPGADTPADDAPAVDAVPRASEEAVARRSPVAAALAARLKQLAADDPDSSDAEAPVGRIVADTVHAALDDAGQTSSRNGSASTTSGGAFERHAPAPTTPAMQAPAAAASSTAQAQAFARVLGEDAEPGQRQMTDLLQSVRLLSTRGGGEMRIRLQPRHFGDLTLTVKVDAGQVITQVAAESAVVREWLESNHHLLRQGLTEQGLSLDRFEVREPQTAEHERSSDEQGGKEREAEDSPKRRRQDETGAVFEVVV